jgi:hypothetical protein
MNDPYLRAGDSIAERSWPTSLGSREAGRLSSEHRAVGGNQEWAVGEDAVVGSDKAIGSEASLPRGP